MAYPSEWPGADMVCHERRHSRVQAGIEFGVPGAPARVSQRLQRHYVRRLEELGLAVTVTAIG